MSEEALAAARRLMARMRRDADCRMAVTALVRGHQCADVPTLAKYHPDVVVMLDESFAEIDESEKAQDEWYQEWDGSMASYEGDGDGAR